MTNARSYPVHRGGKPDPKIADEMKKRAKLRRLICEKDDAPYFPAQTEIDQIAAALGQREREIRKREDEELYKLSDGTDAREPKEPTAL